MATTDQRTGFRLPWTPDARIGTPADTRAPLALDHQPDPEGVAAADPVIAEATEMQETTISDTGTMNWPDVEATVELTIPGSEPDVEASSEMPAEAAPARPRRENLLVTGLVRAMRDAAETARKETAARFAEDAKTTVDAIHAQSAEEAAELRKQAEAEIVEIRDWSKTEMARIREQTEQRIAGRKERLESEVESHATRVEHRIERVQAAIGEFERRMDAFFVRLLAEEDPSRLAGLAEQLPEPPSLDLDELDRAIPGVPQDILDAGGAAAAEAEAFADIDASVDDDMSSGPDDADPADVIADEDVARRLEAFTSHPTPSPDAVTSSLTVVGLVSVASIAGFKRALAKTRGVRSVTVASSTSGDFVFTVNHDPDTDLRSNVPLLDGFDAVVTGDADGVLAITAKDPESTH